MLRLHVYFRDPKVIDFVRRLPARQRSRILERMLLRAVDENRADGIHGDLPRRVAEEVGKWLLEQGLVVSGNTKKSGQENVGQDVPQNPVISFLQRWGDE